MHTKDKLQTCNKCQADDVESEMTVDIESDDNDN